MLERVCAVAGSRVDWLGCPPQVRDDRFVDRLNDRAWDALPVGDRRKFLRAAAVIPALLSPSLPVIAQGSGQSGSVYATDFWSRPRWVWLRRAESAEEIRATYWVDGRLVQSEYDRLVWFLRDLRMERVMASMHRAGKKIPADYYCAFGMSLILLDILYAHCSWLEMFGIREPLWMTSAFRHPLTNAATEGAAKNSLHQTGRAGDTRIHGVRPLDQARFAVWLRGGGVGVYPSRSFTHVDDGRQRVWWG